MQRIIIFFLLSGIMIFSTSAQELALKKGIVMDSLPVNDSIARQIMLYLPADFDPVEKWPILFLCDVEGEAGKKMRYLKAAADKNGYIIATTSALKDSLSLTDKLLTISRSFDELKSLLPLDLDRIYTLGYDAGGQLATIVPSMLRGVNGVLS
ncbi:MAG: alpha/beta hydrolase, partial [Robiginitalea sp.]